MHYFSFIKRIRPYTIAFALMLLLVFSSPGTLFQIPAAYAEQELWILQFGSPFNETLVDVSADSSGVFVTYSAVINGDAEVFIDKYDSDGKALWTKQFGGPGDQTDSHISIYSSDAYVVGATHINGLSSIFFLKYDSNGNQIWQLEIPKPAGSLDFLSDVFADSSGVYVTWTRVTTKSVISLSKYDFNGNEQWTKQSSVVDARERAPRVSTDGSGGVYVAFQTHTGSSDSIFSDIIVRKYDTSGNEQWVKRFGSPDRLERSPQVSADTSGIYIAGSNFTLNGAESDAFIRKYDVNGNEQWTKQFGTTGNERIRGIAVGSSAVYVAGSTTGTFPNNINRGGTDAFVRKYDVNGNEQWTKQFGTADRDEASGVSVTGSNDIFLAGETLGTFPGFTRASTDPNLANWDVFIRKYGDLDTTAPDTSITSAIDGNAKSIGDGGSTLSKSITFAFTGTDAIGVASHECSVDGGAFSACTSPVSYSNLAAGTSHTFKVRAIDKAGNIDGTPATLTWSVLTPAQAVQQIIDMVKNMGLNNGAENSLIAKIDAALKNLNDGNATNDPAVCNQLNAFINEVNAQRGKGLTPAQADQLVLSANNIKASLGCP